MNTFKDFLKEGDVIPFPQKRREQQEKTRPVSAKGRMQQLHDFVADEKNPMADRVNALKKLDDLMGVGGTKVTANDVESYLRDSSK